MNYQEPPLFRWIRANIVTYWKIIAALPIVYSALQQLSLFFEYDDAVIFWFISLLGYAPDVLLYLLFIKYLGLVESPGDPASVVRFAVATSTESNVTGSVREFARVGAVRWFSAYMVVSFISAFLGGFGFYGSFSSIESLFSGVITIACYAFALKETRVAQQNDSHDGASRVLGVSVLYLSLLSIKRLGYFLVYEYGDPINPLFLLVCLALIVTVLWYEQRRYLLVQAVYHAKDTSHIIEPIDPLNPPKGLLTLAYWPNVSFDGILYRIEQSNANDEPFRSNQVKIPLFIVPTQSEPFVGLLSRRLYGYIALLLLSVLFLLEYLARW